jgi:Flp pilus assembly protein TadG
MNIVFMDKKFPFPRYYQKGQSIIEFALALPLFLVLVFGLIDLARYFFYQQSISHTVRSAARYAVTGQLMSNTGFSPTNSNSFQYKTRRESIIAAAQSNNPGYVRITANATNYTSTDNFTISSSTNFSGPFTTNATSGTGDQYIKLTLSVPFEFVTPLLKQVCSALSTNTNIKIVTSLIVKTESFPTNTYNSTNGAGTSTNYWN